MMVNMVGFSKGFSDGFSNGRNARLRDLPGDGEEDAHAAAQGAMAPKNPPFSADENGETTIFNG